MIQWGMKKRKAMKPVFKPYSMDQMLLMPQSYEEIIPEDHLVRVVNRAVDQIDVERLVAEYAGGGTSSYHPKMLLKVLVYGYCQKIYTSRKIAAALRENICFMWLGGGTDRTFGRSTGFVASA
jgi:transposase